MNLQKCRIGIAIDVCSLAPPPLVFSAEYRKFMEIAKNRMVQFLARFAAPKLLGHRFIAAVKITGSQQVFVTGFPQEAREIFRCGRAN
jgi:hypothetical protein